MPPRKHPIGVTRQRILENLIAEHPKPWSEVAKELGIRPQSLYDVVSRMKKKGSIYTQSLTGAVLPSTPSGIPVTQSSATTQVNQDAALRDIESGKITDPSIRRATLDHLIHTGQPGIKLRAIQIREDLDRFAGAQVGPPAPSTPTETISRLGRILLAAGPDLTGKAIAWAAEQKPKEAVSAKKQDSPVSQEPSDGGGSLD